YGSWKMICMSRRAARSSPSESKPRSRPAKFTAPPVGSSSRSTSRPVVDLPQPDSPTNASVSPAESSKLTSSTACPTWRRPRRPLRTGKCFTRPSTLSKGGIPAARVVVRKHFAQRRLLGAAFFRGEGAARREAATRRRCHGIRHLAFDRGQPFGFAMQPWNRAEQADRVGVLRLCEDVVNRRLLDDAAG